MDPTLDCSGSQSSQMESAHKENIVKEAERLETRAAISADVARFLGVMRAERALATEQRPGQTRGSEATSGSEG